MISNTFQTNTFIEGMDCDTDITMLSNKRYRSAENVRILTDQDGNSGVLRNVDQPLHILDNTRANETIIGVTTVDKYGVIATVDNTGRNLFYRYESEKLPDDGLNSKFVVLKGYFNLCQDLDTTPLLSIVGNYESEEVIKIYFTDGNSPIKVFNIMDDRYISPDSSLVDSNGDVINTEALDIVPGAILPPFKLQGLGTGSLPAGVVQYCYQLFNLRNSETTISVTSIPIHLTDSDTSQNSMDYKGADPGSSSFKSVAMEVDLHTHDFEKCRIIRILYEENNQPPSIAIVNEISIDNSVNTISYIDTGNSILSELTVDEFNSLTGYQFTAKTLAKLYNRLFAGNVQDYTWDPGEYDARAYRANIAGQVVLNSSDSSKTLTFDLDTYDLSTIPKDHDCINPTNYSQMSGLGTYEYGIETTDSGNRMLGGHGLNIDYHFVTTDITVVDTQETYYDTSEHPLITNRCSINSFSRPGINAMLFYPVGKEDPEGSSMLGDQIIVNRIYNYADPDIAANFKSYQRDEVYRFGIIFYNSKSIPSPVYWIGDIKMPHANASAPFTYNGMYLYGHPLGIKFTVKNFPEGAVAYDIVRCDRTENDRSIIMQATGQYLYAYLIQENSNFIGNGTVVPGSVEIRPTPLLLNNQVDSYFGGSFRQGMSAPERYNAAFAHAINRHCYRLISPEICLQGKDVEQYFNTSCYLDKIGWMISPTNSIRPGDSSSEDQYIRITSTPYKILTTSGEKMAVDSDYKSHVDRYPDDQSKYVWKSHVESRNPSKTAYRKGEIARYFVTKYFKRPEDNMPFIQDAVYPPNVPYNVNQNLDAYRVNIGENTYSNYAMTEFGISENQVIFGPAGPCVIIKSDNIADYIGSADMSVEGYNQLYSFNAAFLFNIKRAVQNAYGGDTYITRQNSIYISTNSYKEINKSTTTTESYVFGGDIYLGVLDYPNCMLYQSYLGIDDRQEYTQYIGSYIPFETSINLNLMNGDMTHRTWDDSDGYLDTFMQLEPQQTQSFHVQSRPFYAYNAVYSSQPGARIFVPESVYNESNQKTGNRILVSQAKTNNEILDNWTQFKVADYLDVDNQYGNINKLYTFKDRLFYFQDYAVGIASVNERSLITDDNNNQIALGTGGILSRYDYITTSNGVSTVNDKTVCNSENVLYWYDQKRNEICAYDGSVHSLGKEKDVQSYIKTRFLSVLKDEPQHAFFDKRYNEVWFNFQNKALIFNEQIGRFTSLYTLSPQWSNPYPTGVLCMKDNHYYVINPDNHYDQLEDDSKLQIVINKDVAFTKTFDNIRIDGNLRDRANNDVTQGVISNIDFNTKNQTATSNNPTFDYREDTYRLPIPRQHITQDPLSFPARLRGKYLICDYTFNNTDGKSFYIPYIATTYRYSLI